MTDGLFEQVHQEQGIPWFLPPAGAPSCPVLIAKVHFMAGNLLRAKNGSWMLGSAFPPGRPSQANPCDGEPQRMMTKQEKECSCGQWLRSYRIWRVRIIPFLFSIKNLLLGEGSQRGPSMQDS